MSYADDLGLKFKGKNVEILLDVEKSTHKYYDYDLSDNFVLHAFFKDSLSESVVLEVKIGSKHSEIVIHAWEILTIKEHEPGHGLVELFRINKKGR